MSLLLCLPLVIPILIAAACLIAWRRPHLQAALAVCGSGCWS